MKQRLENFELKYIGVAVERAADANIYTFRFRLTPMVISRTMLGDANFKDVGVKVRMPVALVKKWKLGDLETTAAFAFAHCMGIGLDLDCDYVDVGGWAADRKCPLNPVDPVPQVGETWVFACSKAIAFFPFLPQETATQLGEASAPRPRPQPVGKLGKAILTVLGLFAVGVVVNIVGNIFRTDSEGAAWITMLLAGLGVVVHLLNKTRDENAALRRELSDGQRQSE